MEDPSGLARSNLLMNLESPPLPLSPIQQRIWYLEQLAPGSTQFNEPLAYRLRGPLDRGALERAIRTLVAEQESLRTFFGLKGNEPCRFVLPAVPFDLAVEDLESLLEADRRQALAEALEEDDRKPIEITRPPLFRARLLRAGRDSHFLIWNWHHLITDGWSKRILHEELSRLYHSFLHGRVPEPRNTEGGYSRFIRETEAYGETPEARDGIKYWKEQLAGLPDPAIFPSEPEAATSSPMRSGKVVREIDSSVEAAMNRLCRETASTPFMVLLSIFQLLLSRLTGREDITVGTPVAGRPEEWMQQQIGVFIETLPLRTRVVTRTGFREQLVRVKETVLKAFEYQQVPYAEVLESATGQQRRGERPLFRTLFNMYSALDLTPLELEGMEVEELERYSHEAKFDLTLYVGQSRGKYRLTAVFREGLYSSRTVGEYLDQYLLLLRQITEDPDQQIGTCSLITREMRSLLPNPGESLQAEDPHTVLDRFVEMAVRYPDQDAVRKGGESWSFRRLKQCGEEIAGALIRNGVTPGDRVLITGKKSFGLIAAVVGVMRARGVMFLLDPGLPGQRRELLLRECGAAQVLSVEEPVETWGGVFSSLPTLKVNRQGQADPGADPIRESTPGPGPTDPAYIFFTSGTTGQPKGILGHYNGLTHFIEWERKLLNVGRTDKVAQLTGFSFDVIMRDIFLPLISGATVCLPDDSLAHLRGDQMQEWFRREEISILHTVPSLAQAWLSSVDRFPAFTSLRAVLFVGEPLNARLVESWRRDASPSARLVNLYGTTETGMAKAWFEIPDKPPPGIQPIGKAVPGGQLLVLNQSGQLCGFREPGEIGIRSPYGTFGYLSAENGKGSSYISNPFSGDPDDTIYLTGDRGSYDMEARVLIHGRDDDQVKINGVRIEPAEISARLLNHPEVVQCLVVPVAGESGQKRLVAYFRSRESRKAPKPAVLRTFLRQSLPDYMIPDLFIPLARFPLLPNGKVDRANLPPAEFSRAQVSQVAVRPTTRIEEEMAAIWEETLGLSDIGIHDNFFDLGGHSLLAAKLVTLVSRHFKTSLPLLYFSENPTVYDLCRYLEEGDGAVKTGEHRPQKEERRNWLPLSPYQEGIWFIDQIEGDSSDYNLFDSILLEGNLDAGRLEQALDRLVRRHDALRTVFSERAGLPAQSVEPSMDIPLERVRLDEEDPDLRKRLLEEKLRALQKHRFDLARGPLMRAQLIRTGKDQHVFSWVCHSIIFDEGSCRVLYRELGRLYNFPGGELEEAPSHAGYCRRQLNRLTESSLQEQKQFWKGHLRGLADFDLQQTGRESPQRGDPGRAIRFAIGPGTSQRLEEFARRNEISSEKILETIFRILLHRYSGRDDVLTGKTLTNREDPSTRNLVGCLVNLTVNKSDFSGEPSFAEVIQRTREEEEACRPHRGIAFSRLVECLNPPRRKGRHPLFQILVANIGDASSLPQMEGLRTRRLDPPSRGSRFDLEFHLAGEENGWEGTFLFRGGLFSTDYMEALQGHYIRLLEEILLHPGEPVGRLPLLDAAGRERAIREWNRTEVSYPREKSMHQIFQEVARSRPKATAITCEDQSISYESLDHESSRLARRLERQGVSPGDCIGVYCDRSVHLIVGWLAILKAGAAYLPLSKDYPDGRIQYMVEDSGIRLILADEASIRERVPEGTLVLDPREAAETGEADDVHFSVPVPADAPAYVIYTSGSSGNPKGVVLPHRGVVRLVKSQQYATFTPGKRILFLASPSFDASTFDVWGPLLNGAACVVFSPALPELGQLDRVIKEGAVTGLLLPTGLFNLVVDSRIEALASVEEVMTGGEAVSPRHVRKLLDRYPHLKVVNCYGPTECTCIATTNSISAGTAPGDIAPIGRPIANTTAYVLDGSLNPVPPGVAGELYLGGDGLALEYMNQPELTRRRFVPDPFSNQPESRLYKTGDLCQYLPDGRMVFVGRHDKQVKVRGFRVELGEIESALLKHPGIERAVVKTHRDGTAPLAIAAYAVPSGESRTAPTPRELRAYLEPLLPAHVIPASITILPSLPLTANGKVDLEALPHPDSAIRKEEGRPPQTPAEISLAGIWQDLFGLPDIRCEDNFFDLGGHSLLATRLVAEIEKQLGQKVPLSTVFENPTLGQLAARTVHPGEGSARWQSLIPLQSGGDCEPLFCLPGMKGDPYGFVMLARELAPSRPVYGLLAVGVDGSCPRHETVEEMARHYAREIKAFKPEGPYNLLGFSAGGWLAYAVGQEMRRNGDHVRLLVFDPGMIPGAVPAHLALAARILKFFEKLPVHWSRMRGLGLERKLAYAAQRMPPPIRKRFPRRYRNAPETPAGGPAAAPAEQDYFIGVILKYRPRPYLGDMIFFNAEPWRRRSFLAWKHLVRGNFRAVPVEGGHLGLVKEEQVKDIACLFTRILEEEERKEDRGHS